LPRVVVNDLAIAYETDGDPGDAPLLLLHGLGRQLIEWDPEFVDRVVAGGYFVIRMDHRDAGLSSHFGEKVALGEIRQALERGEHVVVPYRLADMAGDVVGLLDHLALPAVHVAGVSMGGMIGQALAILAPERVQSLTSIMAATGDWSVGLPSAAGLRALLRAPPPDRAGAIEAALETRRLLATPGTFDEPAERAVVAAAIDRSFDPAAVGRQLAAMWASGDRTERLRSLAVPTLVIHGTNDHLIDFSGAAATAAAIPGARLIAIAGMGHDLPREHWDQVLTVLFDHLEGAKPTP
jgi:pimeloyl-ACP methyl ester carboxylesterase